MRFLVTILLVTLTLILLPTSTASANPLWPGFFELTDRPYSLDIPPQGSVWEALISAGGAPVDSITMVVVEQADEGLRGVHVREDRQRRHRLPPDVRVATFEQGSQAGHDALSQAGFRHLGDGRDQREIQFRPAPHEPRPTPHRRKPPRSADAGH